MSDNITSQVAEILATRFIDLTSNRTAKQLAAHDLSLDWHQTITLGTTVKRDSIGRQLPNGKMGRNWLVFQCNNSECGYEVIVNCSDLADLIEYEFPL